MTASVLLTRYGNEAARPALKVGEIAYDIDSKTYVVGDGTPNPPRIMTTKSTGSFDLTSIEEILLPETTKEAIAIKGDSGWSPVFEFVEYENRLLLRILDWTGGEGDKPSAGLFLRINGEPTPNPNLAMNVKGTQGPPGAPPLVNLVMNDSGELIFKIHYSSEEIDVTSEINEDGELIITYGDEAKQEFNVGRLHTFLGSALIPDTSYTLMSSDHGKLLAFTSDDPITVTIPNDDFGTTMSVTVLQKGEGTIVFNWDSNEIEVVSLQDASATMGTGSLVSVSYVSDGYWLLVGNIV